MTWDRIQRQEAILREKISVIVIERLNDPRLGFVTITAVKLSRDKHYCTVKYTVLGSDAERRNTSRALLDAAPRVRELLAPSLKTRVLPELRFEYDEVVVKESRLRTLIEEVTAERLEREAQAAELAGSEDGASDGTEADAHAGPGVEADVEADADVEGGAGADLLQSTDGTRPAADEPQGTGPDGRS